MDAVADNRIEHFLADIEAASAEQAMIIRSVQSLFMSENPALVQDIKYGGLVFLRENKLAGGIFAYRQHISVEFSHGAGFEDPDQLLEGKGKQRRHLKIKHSEDTARLNLNFYIRQAVVSDTASE